ncbi:sterol desaturase family protein [Ramlibacter sp. MMS24-I3-19]|uniref:sterol desaturase family protein n=1 Tax=Ramlibacter sp. MMS24-I3-19 TaxID=3416606 RepID=UPI003D00ED6E
MNWVETIFGSAQQWLFEAAVQPLMFALGLANFLEDAYGATGWLLVGLVQIGMLLLVIGPLQRWRPVEPITDRAAVRTDVLYTLIHRLGLFRVGLFFVMEPVFDALFGHLHVLGVAGAHLDNLWPGLTDLPWLSFLLYLLAFDLADYWIHRGQHAWRWWWSLHALHHSQRQMTMWSDNRNHLLDDLLRDSLLVVLAQLIGVAPGQFVAIVAITQLSESLQHANLRLSFGRWGERLWISPRFHRVHHGIGIGHERRGRGTLGGHNFGVLLPWWDMLFGTADFEHHATTTGVRDQVEQGRDYGRGFWSQQWLGLKRLAGRG